MQKSKFEIVLKNIAMMVVNFLVLLSAVSGFILACIELVLLISDAINEPPVGLINGHKLYALFSLILIVVLGIYIIKSIFNILKNNDFSAIAMIQVALITIANKVITLELKDVSMPAMVGMSIVVTSLSLCYFLLQFKSRKLPSWMRK